MRDCNVSVPFRGLSKRKPRHLKRPLAKSSTQHFRKPLAEVHFSHFINLFFALLRLLKNLKLFTCQGSRLFREPPRIFPLAWVHEKRRCNESNSICSRCRALSLLNSIMPHRTHESPFGRPLFQRRSRILEQHTSSSARLKHQHQY